MENVLATGLQFAVGVILARLLSPAEFGLIGMTVIFTAVARSVVDSGLSSALIRKKVCTQSEFSTVFYYNLVVSIVFYGFLFAIAPAISRFFDQPVLTALVRVISLSLIINATAQIQRTRLIKEIDFRRQTIITAVAVVFSGALGVYLAFRGAGVWSLVWMEISRNVVISILLWASGGWRPTLEFSMPAFREMFGFGSRLMISGLIDTVYQNIYYLVIGKYFSSADLGFYTRARRFRDLIGRHLTAVMQRVTYPVLASIGDEPERLKAFYRKLILGASLLTAILMLGMAAGARAMVLSLIGEKWSPCIPYLQLMCLSGMILPLHAINLNMLAVRGRSDLVLRLEIIKKILAVPVILAGIFYGILTMLTAMIATSYLSLFLNTYYSGQLIGYSTRAQIRDVMPNWGVALIVALLMYGVELFPIKTPVLVLGLQAAVGAASVGMYFLFSRSEPAVEARRMAGDIWGKVRARRL